MTPKAPIPGSAERPPLLMGDHPAMHLLNSRATPGGQPMEWIGDGDAFGRWLHDVGVPADDARAAASEAELEDAARRARALREWFRGFVAAHAGRPLTPAALDALEPLNDVLHEDDVYRSVAASDGGLAWRLVSRKSGVQALVQPLAVAIGNLVCDEDFARVRQCDGPGCSIWFLDRTKSGQRRWCSMALCGNRAKASLHRARARTAPPA
jgi:predicted RNA-binding Zn ribbon-like protein